MTQQRRQPVTYAEVQEVQRTGDLPLMDEPVKPGQTPYCLNCCYWEKEGPHMGLCHNDKAIQHNPMAGIGALWGRTPVGMCTGGMYHCPEHQQWTLVADGDASDQRPAAPS